MNRWVVDGSRSRPGTMSLGLGDAPTALRWPAVVCRIKTERAVAHRASSVVEFRLTAAGVVGHSVAEVGCSAGAAQAITSPGPRLLTP